MRPRPRIGVTGPDGGAGVAWLATALRLRALGARPVRVRPRRPIDVCELDGLVLGGGADVDPRRYGGPPQAAPSRRLHDVDRRDLHAHRFRRLRRRLVIRPFKRTLGVGARPIDLARDALESTLFGDALEAGLPVLGICRGAQLMNVVRGGTLHRDLRDSELHPSSRYGLRAKDIVDVAPGSRLHAALGRTRLVVNSLHNQAVDRPGRGLRVVAHDQDGVVEGVEMSAAPFVVGVQWHPEYLPRRAEQTRLFAALVAAAARRASA